MARTDPRWEGGQGEQRESVVSPRGPRRLGEDCSRGPGLGAFLQVSEGETAGHVGGVDAGWE